MIENSKKTMISSFYKFIRLSPTDLEQIRTEICSLGKRLDMRGLFVLGTEGINSTLSGTEKNVIEFKSQLLQTLNLKSIDFKDSWAEGHVFKRWKVKIRHEIIKNGHRIADEQEVNQNHLSPQEWHEALQQEDTVVLDTRNFYEIEMGSFKNAIDPKISDFQEFGDFVKTSEIDRTKKVLIFCTGGIRCEKAIIDLNKNGYKNVYQLNGGIINYLKEYPDQAYEGECFVFDHRVGLDQQLQASKEYHLCPHCGNPGNVAIECHHCETQAVVCKHCLKREPEVPAVHTCSKNCAHHLKLGHKCKNPKSSKHKRNKALL